MFRCLTCLAGREVVAGVSCRTRHSRGEWGRRLLDRLGPTRKLKATQAHHSSQLHEMLRRDADESAAEKR